MRISAKALTARSIMVKWEDREYSRFPDAFYQIRVKVLSPRKAQRKTEFRNVTDKATASDNEFVVTKLTPFTKYDFSVRKVAGLMSSWSLSVKSMTQSTKPESPPRNLAAVESAGRDSVQLTWQPPERANGEIIGYRISYKKVNAPETEWETEKVQGDALTCPIGNTEPDTLYQFRIRAQNDKGFGPDSPDCLLTTAASVAQATFSENFWYILIGIVATLTIVVVFIIIFLVRHNNKKNEAKNMDPNRPLYSQGHPSQASEDLFEVRQPIRFVGNFYFTNTKLNSLVS